MGDNTTTRRELDHRAELRSISDKVAKKMNLDSFDTYGLYNLLLTEFNDRKLWIVHNSSMKPAGDDTA